MCVCVCVCACVCERETQGPMGCDYVKHKSVDIIPGKTSRLLTKEGPEIPGAKKAS